MFANTTPVGFAQRVVATLVASAVLLWSVGTYTTAQAANLTNVSDTLSSTATSTEPTHDLRFTIPVGSILDAADTFTIAFPTSPGSGFVIDNLTSGDLTVTVNAVGATVDSFATTTSVITMSLDTTANAGEEVIVAIAGSIINPDTTGSGDPGSTGEIIITTPTDVGKTRVAIIETVEVTAIVSTSFDFTIAGMATSTAVNGTSTTGSTTATLIPFGTIYDGEVHTLAQRLYVSTNARNGFIVTVQSDGYFESATGAIIDVFDDGSDVSAAGTVWNSPSNDINDEHTWGHWGMTYDDSDNGPIALGANEYLAVSSTTPRTVFGHNGPSDGTTVDIGTTTVGYTLEITALQEAADDYSTVLTYVATPTF